MVKFISRNRNRILPSNLTVRIDIKRGMATLKYRRKVLIEIGYCKWDVDNKKVIYFRSFSIEKKYQNKGYGYFFASVILALFKGMRVRQVYLVDAATNEKFWNRLGFKHGPRDNGYKYLTFYR